MNTPVTASGAPATGTAALAPGGSVGGYRVVRLLGAGGMGAVYLARDTRLDRLAAIKVLHRTAAGSDDLLAEAQAMAKLSHRNVVTVYEAGTLGDQVYLAMEYVDGSTLRGWLAEAPRPWREVAAVFVAAGRGLAAAHAAGIVHRDFKPENVLVGKDGRVCVGDFGLAAAVAGPPSEEELGVAATVRYSAGVAGTPAYMAPEQHLCEEIDARADEFAFCVALHEALYGARPFEGENLAEIRAQVLGGASIHPPPRPGLPAWLRAAVLRGLAVDRDARFPSMDALLAAIGRDPSARRRRLALGAALAATTTLAAVAVLVRPAAAPACDGGVARLARAWNPAVALALRGALLGTGRSYAADTADRTIAALDRYGADWSSMHREACEATLVRHEQSAALLDRRMACLDRRLGALGALAVEIARRPSERILDRAPRAVAELDRIDGCADAAALAAAVPPPDDPGDGALAESSLREGLLAAARAHDDTLLCTMWGDLIGVVGQKGRTDEALAMQPAAEAAIARAGDPAREHGKVLNGLGTVYIIAGKSAEAAAAFRRSLPYFEHDEVSRMVAENNLGLALTDGGDLEGAAAALGAARELATSVYGPESPWTAYVSLNLATVEEKRGRLAEARAVLERALATCRRALGAKNGNCAKALNNLGEVHAEAGRLDEARAAFEEALAIKEASFGPEHPDTLSSVENLAALHVRLGRPLDGRAYSERALGVRERVLGLENVALVSSLVTRGRIEAALGRLAEARAAETRALAIAEKTTGPDGVAAADVRAALADLALQSGRGGEALDGHRRALATREKRLGPSHPAVAAALAGIGQSLLALAQAAEAVESLERAVAIRERVEGDPHDLAAARFLLARALWDARGDRARAVGLARDARAQYAAEGDRARSEIAEVDRWLARR